LFEAKKAWKRGKREKKHKKASIPSLSWVRGYDKPDRFSMARPGGGSGTPASGVILIV